MAAINNCARRPDPSLRNRVRGGSCANLKQPFDLRLHQGRFSLFQLGKVLK